MLDINKILEQVLDHYLLLERGHRDDDYAAFITGQEGNDLVIMIGYYEFPYGYNDARYYLYNTLTGLISPK